MLAGGTEATIIPIGLGGFVACRALSQRNDEPHTASRPWDKDRDGFVMGEGVSPEEVNYINAHTTSTIVGDLAEVNAIKSVFKNTSEIKINATKSRIGHCLGAAEPSVEFDTVANAKKQHEVNVAVSNSFGFGGHNSVVVFAPYKP
ncbi:hypothetical protein SUGI_0454370 [Cryptomeria japonica]|nr:hypothetical protein SUGI_0454370 [Cryptomeria japonica]